MKLIADRFGELYDSTVGCILRGVSSEVRFGLPSFRGVTQEQAKTAADVIEDFNFDYSIKYAKHKK